MQTWIYKSNKREFTYIYLGKEDDFSVIPESLQPYLGDLSFVIQIDLEKTTNLANADITKVKQDINHQGFYLQIPPASKEQKT